MSKANPPIVEGISVEHPSRSSISPAEFATAEGWACRRLTPPSALVGANGMRFGPEGDLYVAQYLGSRISALDLTLGTARHLICRGGDIKAPDDLAFNEHGALFATEVMHGRVSMRHPDGTTQVLADDIPAANGITLHDGRLFVDEFRSDGRLLEIYVDGRAPRVIAENLAMPNALCVGPDGMLYFPAVLAGEIWRVSPEGGHPECVKRGLAMPVAVKVDARGRLVTTEAATGKILEIDVQNDSTRVRGHTRIGIDNCVFDSDNRLYVSNFLDGGVSEIVSGHVEREVVAAGLLGPWGISCGPNEGVYLADGMSIVSIDAHGSATRLASFFSHGFPGFIRNLLVMNHGEFTVATSAGNVVRYLPGGDDDLLLTGLDQITGMAVGAEGEIVVCEYGTGRLHSIKGNEHRVIGSNLGWPTGVASSTDGGFFVADAKQGRVLHVRSGSLSTLASGLGEPHGMVRVRDALYVVDRSARTLLCVSPKDGHAQTIAANLPIGDRPGGYCGVLPGSALVPGPLLPFVGLAADSEGRLYVAGDAEGSVLMFSPAVQGEPRTSPSPDSTSRRY